MKDETCQANGCELKAVETIELDSGQTFEVCTRHSEKSKISPEKW